jgi:hypothetical protein
MPACAADTRTNRLPNNSVPGNLPFSASALSRPTARTANGRAALTAFMP